MTPQEALEMISTYTAEVKAGKAPESKLVAACNTIALEAPKWAQQSLSRDKKLFEAIQALDKKLKVALNPLDPTLAPEDQAPRHDAPEPTEAAPVDTGPRVGMDGKPMTPEEAAREAAMDAAIAASGPDDNAAPQPQARANRWADPKATPPPRAAAAPPPPQANGQAPAAPKA